MYEHTAVTWSHFSTPKPISYPLSSPSFRYVKFLYLCAVSSSVALYNAYFSNCVSVPSRRYLLLRSYIPTFKLRRSSSYYLPRCLRDIFRFVTSFGNIVCRIFISLYTNFHQRFAIALHRCCLES